MVGKDSRAKAGLWHGSSQTPTGYDYIDGQLVVNDYEAMQVREAADLFIKRTPARAIAQLLNNKGYRRKGKEWDSTTLRRILENPVNIGKIKHRDKVYDGQHKPILDRDTFDKIQEVFAEREEQFAQFRKLGVKSLLGGITYCKRCGAKYTRQQNGKNTTYYCCHSRCKKVPKMVKDPNCKNKNYRTDQLDLTIMMEINKLAIDKDYVEQLRADRPENDATEKVEALNTEIENITSQISKMMDLYALGHFDLDTINQKVAALNESKINLQKEIDALNGSKDEKAKLTPEQVQSIAELFNAPDLTLEQKRSIVQSLIYYIEIDGDDIFIHWKF